MDYVADAADAEGHSGIVGTDRYIWRTGIIPIVVRILAAIPDCTDIIIDEKCAAGIRRDVVICPYVLKISILAHKHKLLLIWDTPLPRIRPVRLFRIGCAEGIFLYLFQIKSSSQCGRGHLERGKQRVLRVSVLVNRILSSHLLLAQSPCTYDPDCIGGRIGL